MRSKILYTVLLIFVYLIGTHIVLPGIDPTQLAQNMSKTSNGILGLIDTFAGGAFSQASIFALGIMPYISASIVVQLLGMALPYFRKMQMEGESGRKKINQITRFLTVIITVFQCPGYIATQITNKAGVVADPRTFW